MERDGRRRQIIQRLGSGEPSQGHPNSGDRLPPLQPKGERTSPVQLPPLWSLQLPPNDVLSGYPQPLGDLSNPAGLSVGNSVPTGRRLHDRPQITGTTQDQLPQLQQVTHQNLDVVNARLSEHASAPRQAAVWPSVSNAGIQTPNGTFVPQKDIEDLETLRLEHPTRDINAKLTDFDRAIGRKNPGKRAKADRLPSVARALAIQKVIHREWAPRDIREQLTVGETAATGLIDASKTIAHVSDMGAAADGTWTPSGGTFVPQKAIEDLETLRLEHSARDINAKLTAFDHAIGRKNPGKRAKGDKLSSVARALAVRKVLDDDNWNATDIEVEFTVNRGSAYKLLNNIRATARVSEDIPPPQAESSATGAARNRGLEPRPQERKDSR